VSLNPLNADLNPICYLLALLAQHFLHVSRIRVNETFGLCCLIKSTVLDDWLTVHRSITLVDFQLDAQNSYLFIYNRFIKILYMFRALPCSSSGGVRRNCVYVASGIVAICM